MDCDVSLFISTNVGGCGSDSDVSIESEEGKDDKEDTAFKDSGFKKWMLRGI
jgi:hypothetical protein